MELSFEAIISKPEKHALTLHLQITNKPIGLQDNDYLEQRTDILSWKTGNSSPYTWVKTNTFRMIRINCFI